MMNIFEISALETPFKMRREIIRLALERNVSEEDIWLEVAAHRKICGEGERPRVPVFISNILKMILPTDISKLKITESPMEDLVKYELQARGINFQTQKKIGKYRVDFFFPQMNLVVEIDGRRYHSTTEQKDKDMDRELAIVKKGYTVLRFSGSEIYQDVVTCVNKIARLL